MRPRRPGAHNPKARKGDFGFLDDLGRMWGQGQSQLQIGDLCRWCGGQLIRHDVVYVICPTCDQSDATPLPDVPQPV